MVKKYMFYVGQRPKYTRTNVGALAEQGISNIYKNLILNY
jgi:hypothetical protein